MRRPNANVREENMSGEFQAPRTRPPARIITSAWGERYVDDLLSVTLPAVLAPGNLPALVDAFDCEFIIVTQQAMFDTIERAPVLKGIRALCPARLVPLDDLIFRSDMYGLSLTYAYHRGFADLGERMLDYHLFFLNSDFIIADGSYRKLIELIRDGERLIVAPSYCAYDEAVRPLLLDRIAAGDGVLALAPRELAEIGLRNRHHTIKGKTVNCPVFHLEWIEQFYWAVDEHTLLAHQMPIAVVYLRPERIYIEPVTLWDYGLVSEICPTARHCVIGDSDDFCMIELRGFVTAEVDMIAGAPTAEETARKLSSFYTKDHANFGRYPLVLHSRALPPGFRKAQQDLQDYVDRVYALLTPPNSHIDHSYWRYHHPKFIRFRAEDYVKQQLLGSAAGRPTRHAMPTEFNSISIRYPEDPAAAPNRRRLSRLHSRLLGRLPHATRWHAYWSIFRPVVLQLQSDLKIGRLRMLIASDNRVASRMLESTPGTLVSMPAAIAARHRLFPVDASYRGTPVTAEPPPPDRALAFDYCFCELSHADIEGFRALMTNVASAMASGSKIVVFYFDGEPINRRVVSRLLTRLPSLERTAVTFSGFAKLSAAHAAYRLFRIGAGRYRRRSLIDRLVAAACFGLSMPLAFMANTRGVQKPGNQVPELCMTVTIEMTIG